MNSAVPFRLGDWLVQPDLNRVTGPDGEVRLEPRVMLVLVRLAVLPGEVVSRDTLLDEVWEGTFVGEESLTRAISDLRRAFGDDARNPAYIETIRQKGYRLVAELEPVKADDLPAARDAAPEAEPDIPAEVTTETERRPLFPFRPPRKPFRPWGTVASLAVIALLFAGQRYLLSDDPEPAHTSDTSPAARIVPLTTYPGHERHPALSADGTRVAFVWDGPDGGAEGVWVKQRNSETPLQLSGGPGRAAWPVWSPDAQSVAWVQVLGDSSEIRSVPGLGGATRVLFATRGLVAGLDWHPDGGSLLFSWPREGFHNLASLDLETLAVRPASGNGMSRVQPRISPDGTRTAFIALTRSASGVVVNDGHADRWLVEGLTNIQGLAWSAASDRLVFAAEHAGMFQLWTVPLAGGDPQRLTATGDFAWNPTIASRSGDLAWEQVRVDQDLWRIKVLGSDPWRLETGRFLASTRWEYEAVYSPDGNLIAFISARSGTPELWVCERDGGNPRRLTDTGGAPLMNPRWSADGAQLAYNVLENGRDVIRVISARGGASRTITPAGGDEMLVGWAPGATALEFVTGTELRRRTVAAADDMAGSADELVKTGIVTAARDENGGLFFVSTDAPRAIRGPGALVNGLDPLDLHNWRIASGAIYWVLRSGGRAFLMVHDLAGGTDVFMTDLPGFAGTGLAVEPAGGEVLYPRSGTAEGDLMLLSAE